MTHRLTVIDTHPEAMRWFAACDCGWWASHPQLGRVLGSYADHLPTDAVYRGERSESDKLRVELTEPTQDQDDPPDNRPDNPPTKWSSLMSLRETATALGCSESTLYRLIKEGRAPVEARMVGSRWRFSRRQVERFVNGDES
jgi:excisionase family DNA binding protein